MTSLDGMPYASLATAFKHRVSYDASCTCTPSPWTEASAERHRLYAARAGCVERRSARARRRSPHWPALCTRPASRPARGTGADLVASRSAEVIAGASRQRVAGRRKAAAREPIGAGKGPRNRARQRLRPVRQVEVQVPIARVLRAGTSHRGRRAPHPRVRCPHGYSPLVRRSSPTALVRPNRRASSGSAAQARSCSSMT